MCATNKTQDIRDTLFNSLTQQLDELELLKSMYPNKHEIVLTDSKIIEKIQNFLNNESEYTPTHLDYTINLHLNNLKLEICVNLPTMYPEEEPDIYIRCNQLNRQQETQLNSGLLCYLKNNHYGDVCLHTAISWLQDNIHSFVSTNIEILNKCEEKINTKQDQYVRIWVYSHHIYNKKKREEIVKRAKDLTLTGFCLPGKPGIVCIEGTNVNCNEWWKDIKCMSWKKIGIRKTEVLESPEQQKFSNFQEIHADMSKFSKYMETCGLSQDFNDVFGLNNAG